MVVQSDRTGVPGSRVAAIEELSPSSQRLKMFSGQQLVKRLEAVGAGKTNCGWMAPPRSSSQNQRQERPSH